MGVGGNDGLGVGMNVGNTDGNSDVEDGEDVVDGLDVGELVIGEYVVVGGGGAGIVGEVVGLSVGGYVVDTRIGIGILAGRHGLPFSEMRTVAYAGLA